MVSEYVEKLTKISEFLQKLKSLLKEGGQILLDSSDIIYMFDEDEDGGKWIPSDVEYYGEVIFNVSYKKEKEEPFDWIYIDYNTLQNAAHANGLNCELILEGEHYDYLARLYKIQNPQLRLVFYTLRNNGLLHIFNHNALKSHTPFLIPASCPFSKITPFLEANFLPTGLS